MAFQSVGDKHIDQLIAGAKKRAENIKNGTPKNTEELEQVLRWRWCQQYNLPMKHPMLDNYTVEELLFEFFLHQEPVKMTAGNVSELIKENKEELANLFDEDFAEFNKSSKTELSKDDVAFMDAVFPKENQEPVDWSMGESDFK